MYTGEMGSIQALSNVSGRAGIAGDCAHELGAASVPSRLQLLARRVV